MSIIGSNILAGAAGQGGGYVIEESLRFNSSQSSYLSWTPATAGNRKTWTWSAWVKLGNVNAAQSTYFSGVNTSTNSSGTVIRSEGNTLEIMQYENNAFTFKVESAAVYRDPSAWYHFIVAVDTTQATASNRVKLFVNGAQITSFTTANYPVQNSDCLVNNTVQHLIGAERFQGGSPQKFKDGYLTEVNFIDGQALTPSSFGEYNVDSGVWQPAKYAGSYGTNGFYLPMKLDNTTEGFNTVTYLGNGATNKVSGVGFSPDLVWVKDRVDGSENNWLFDTVRGAPLGLSSNLTSGEFTLSTSLTSFNADGFSVGTDGKSNRSGDSYVAWCWDAGGTTVSNADGSITSSVRANPAYGFSVVTWTGNGVNTAQSIGHGLSSVPKFLIIKSRTTGYNWTALHGATTNGTYNLNTTGAINTGWAGSSNGAFNPSNVSSTTFSTAPGSASSIYPNQNGDNYVAYCFSEIAGYSKISSYTANTTTPPVVTGLGFRPAFLMVKNTSRGEDWAIVDNTRDVGAPITKYLAPNNSAAEVSSVGRVTFNDDGFTINAPAGYTFNFQTGDTYIYMAFKDTREYAFWLDDSGNNNDWQPNGGITTESTVTDTPTPYADGGNYAVLNPLQSTIAPTGGNLEIASGGGETCPKATIQLPLTGKWYWETYCTQTGTDNFIGVTTNAGGLTFSGTERSYRKTGVKSNNGVTTSYGATWASGDTLGVAVDMDAGSITFYKNGVSQGVAFTDLTGINWSPHFYCYINAGHAVNFGQRPFAYTPPTGFKTLHTGNLPDSAIVNGAAYFAATLYSGNGGPLTINNEVNGVGFQPDWIWSKSRDSVGSNAVNDSVRGADARLNTESTGAETTQAGFPDSYNANGVTLDSFVTSGKDYVLWQWKAGGAAVSNTSGSITSQVSASPTAGFSVVTYTGTGSAATVGHGLGAVPRFIIAKRRNAAVNWFVGSGAFPSWSYALEGLNTTSAANSGATAVWNATTPTSSVFSIGSDLGASGGTYVAYCFSEVSGYSSFGSYVGNGNSNGPFVNLGFRPAFVIIKGTLNTGDNWRVFDAARNPYNFCNLDLYPNLSNAEGTNTGGIDLVSNGFKVRNGGSDTNTNANTYIYMAFAENPFKNSLAR
jgi:hypothetical protein